MQETLHDRNGNAVAYIDYDDESTIYMWNGKPVAYLSDNNTIYGFNGKHLGWYEDGTFWNLQGEKAGFNKNASPVFTKFEPFKSFKNFKPFKSFKEFSKMKPFKKNSISAASLEQHLLGGGK